MKTMKSGGKKDIRRAADAALQNGNLFRLHGMVWGLLDYIDEEKPESQTLASTFTRRWVCNVVRSGYHNGAHCTPDEPHTAWECGYRWESTLSDEDMERLVTTEPAS